MNKITELLVFFLILFCAHSSGQNNSDNSVIRCSTKEYNEVLRKTHPQILTVDILNKIVEKSQSLRASSPQDIIRIPVVVHVIHNGEAIGVGANISDAQVISQINVLNEDYRRESGTNGFNTHPNGADTEIEFYLAQEDPNCNPTNGIDRIDMSATNMSWSGPNGNTDSVLKPQTIWDRDRYLNIWTVVFSNSNNLGYAQFPGGPAETDGVVINHEIFGSNEAAGVTITDPLYNLGRTTTHEVGHFLGLFHTFEGLNCTGNGDGIDDTPQTDQENYGCPAIAPDSCPSEPGDDMIENYMDYSDDICMNVFTNGQSAVMNSVLNDADLRLALANSDVSDTPLANVNYDGSVVIADLNEDKCSGFIAPEVIVGNYGTQTLTAATLTYNINGGSNVILNWTGNLSQGETESVFLPSMVSPNGSNSFQISISQSNSDQRICNDDDSEAFFGVNSYTDTSTITLTLTTDDYAEETSWEFRNSNGDILYSDSYNQSDDNTTFVENFDVLSNECYSFTIFDAEADGICCGFGTGSYELRTDDNTLIFSGGEFASTESTQISTQTLSTNDYFTNNKVRIYPNPVHNLLRFSVGRNNEKVDSFEIYNMLGQMVLKKVVNSKVDHYINTASLSKGMYFIRLTKEGSNYSSPFIKR